MNHTLPQLVDLLLSGSEWVTALLCVTGREVRSGTPPVHLRRDPSNKIEGSQTSHLNNLEEFDRRRQPSDHRRGERTQQLAEMIRATMTTVAKHSGLAPAALAARFDAIVFDKDGTLLDFGATWHGALFDAITEVAHNDMAQQTAIASALGFDMEARTTIPDAPFVHQSNDELALLLSPITDGRALINCCAANVIKHVTAVPRGRAVLEALSASGIPAAVATNDEEGCARQQLEALRWLGEAPLLSAILGCDSGHGAKPAPGMLLAAAAALNVPPSRCAMIGDAAGDMHAARRAGFAACILVGPPETVGQHAPLSDFWITDLGELLEPPRSGPV